MDGLSRFWGCSAGAGCVLASVAGAPSVIHFLAGLPIALSAQWPQTAASVVPSTTMSRDSVQVCAIVCLDAQQRMLLFSINCNTSTVVGNGVTSCPGVPPLVPIHAFQTFHVTALYCSAVLKMYLFWTHSFLSQPIKNQQLAQLSVSIRQSCTATIQNRSPVALFLQQATTAIWQLHQLKM
jgi:hypothetical protein